MDLVELTSKILDRRSGPDQPLRIVQAGHPALRRPAVRAEGRLGQEMLRALVDAMTVTMREAPGVGLAAPQIGLPLRVIVVEDRIAGTAGPDGPSPADPLERSAFPLRAFVDPQLDLLGEEWVYAWEGCLSVEGWQSVVPRSRRVRLRALEVQEDGSVVPVTEELAGWPARILQHETDHLDGTLCHDRMVPRSFIDSSYASHYEDLGEAVRRLGLQGEITRLREDEVVIRR